jgi:hypothetical protein
MEELLMAALLADAGVAAIVGGRISWATRPADWPLPGIVLHKISGPQDYTMQGRVPTVGWLIQMDCWANSFLDSTKLARALKTCLDTLATPPLQAFLENDHGDPLTAGDGPQGSAPTNLFRTTLDVRVWCSAA